MPSCSAQLRPRTVSAAPGRAEGRGVVERRPERAALREPRVDVLHHLAAEQVAAAPALVEDGGVVEERLDQVDLLADEPAEPLHRVEHAPEQAQARAAPARGRGRPSSRAAPRPRCATPCRRACRGRRDRGRWRSAPVAGSAICTKASSGTDSGDISMSTRSAGSRSSAAARTSMRAHGLSSGAVTRTSRAPSAPHRVDGLMPKRSKQLLGDEPRVERLRHLARERVDLLDRADARGPRRARPR